MASTNKTTNYELSQFLGSDKPAWLSDYNSDMSKIDTGLKNAADAATAAGGEATSAATAIGTLTNLTTEDKTSAVAAINEVDSHADTAQNTANSATTMATNAITGVNNLKAMFDLGTITSLTGSSSQLTPNVSVTCAKNSSGTLAKIYGRVRFTGGYNGTITCTLSDTGLRPADAITFNGCAIRARTLNDNSSGTFTQSYTLNTNGTITMTVSSSTTTVQTDVIMIACLLFIEDFGDVVPSE